MGYRITLLAIFEICCVVYGQQGPCEIGLNGGQGQCKSIFKCQTLLMVVNKVNKTLEDKRLLKRSHCGIDDDAPAVCCGDQSDAKPCYTPEGKNGQCIDLYSCPTLLNLLTTPVIDAKYQFVQNSRCNGKNKYNVCCGPVPNLDRVTIGQCTPNAFPPEPRTACCGVDASTDSKILGLEVTEIDKHPWLALIEFVKNSKIKVYDGGALISGLYVLSIASTVTKETLGKPVNIRLGDYDTSTDSGPDCEDVLGGGEDCTDGPIRIRIEKIIPHPQYDSGRNDIALIRLSRMAPFTDFIRPICLPTMDITQKTDNFFLIAAGWGAIDYNAQSTDKKKHVDLPYVNRNDCQKEYNEPPRNVTIGTELFCAGGVAGQDTCRGGNTLMYKNRKTYEYAGLLSFGAIVCGTKDIPTVYTNIYEYNTWIRNTIAP